MGFQRAHRELLRLGRWFLLVNALNLWSSAVLAQDANSRDADPASPDPPKTQQIAERDPQTIFPHSDTARWGVSGQINIIAEGHGGFRALFTGPEKPNPQGGVRASRFSTP